MHHDTSPMYFSLTLIHVCNCGVAVSQNWANRPPKKKGAPFLAIKFPHPGVRYLQTNGFRGFLAGYENLGQHSGSEVFLEATWKKHHVPESPWFKIIMKRINLYILEAMWYTFCSFIVLQVGFVIPFERNLFQPRKTKGFQNAYVPQLNIAT